MFLNRIRKHVGDEEFDSNDSIFKYVTDKSNCSLEIKEPNEIFMPDLSYYLGRKKLKYLDMAPGSP